MSANNRGRYYRVTVRRTVVQTQTVQFIADNQIDSEQQKRIAAAYAQPELWVDDHDETVTVSLDSDPIVWTLQ